MAAMGGRHDRRGRVPGAKAILRRLKLSPMLDTLPERVALARQQKDALSGLLGAELWSELTTLRFLDDANNVLGMGPVGVGKTFMASALGNIACRRRHSVLMLRADRMLKRLKAARLDASHALVRRVSL